MALMKPEARERFFAKLAKANPNPNSDLEYSTSFELLTAVLLSAQATDKGVNIATRKLFPVANTPQAILDLGEAGLIEYVKTIGLFRSKAKHLMETCAMLIEHHGGEVPDDREALEALPGVGRKTANVVLNIAFGHPTMAVDTHIFRVGNRCGLAPGKDPLAVEMKLLKAVPQQYMQHGHHWLILHGRYTCVARTPRCSECIVFDECGFKDKTKIRETQVADVAKKSVSKGEIAKAIRRATK
jgi:endonuclease III